MNIPNRYRTLLIRQWPKSVKNTMLYVNIFFPRIRYLLNR